MHIGFLNPIALFLLLALPLAVLLAVKSRAGLEGVRKHLSLALRLVILALLVLAIAELQLIRESDDLAVLFLLDWSESVPADIKRASWDYVKKACEHMDPNKDRAGMVLFGGDASVEFSPTRMVKLDAAPASVVQTKLTDLSAGIRLALAAFPEGVQKRIVLLSDGNENKGSALDEAENARVNGARVECLPLQVSLPREVWFDSLLVPNEVKKSESFEVKLVVNSLKASDAVVRLFQNGALVLTEDVKLVAGKNVFVLPRKLDQPGFFTYEALVEAKGADDTLAENNRAYGFTFIRGEPKVLYIEGDEKAAHFLTDALLSEKIQVDAVGVSGLPSNLAELQNYDAVILSNVGAHYLADSQKKMFASAVRDLGIGFTMIGGEESFGPGGYQDSPIEEALPVLMDIPQRKVIPKGALVIIMHTCEIPDGNTWAKEIAIAALSVLSARDLFGVLLFDMAGEHWQPTLTEVGDKSKLIRIIKTMTPSDMPSFDNTLRMAYGDLKRSDAMIKHIVIISDGDPAQPAQALISNIVNAGITVSAVGIAPHGPGCTDMLRMIAQTWGKGRYYEPSSARHLPQIFVKEAAVIRKSLIAERDFRPAPGDPTEILKGLSASEIPTLHGYVLTTPKPKAEVHLRFPEEDKDPILATWRFGLGKTLAFTSDAKNRWASDWVNWGKYSKFWAQSVRWTLREASKSEFRMTTEIVGGKGTVMLDAVDTSGRFVNNLDLHGRLVLPTFEGEGLQFDQVAPGRYEAHFRADEVGSYMVNLDYSGEGGVQGGAMGGVSVPYASEYRDMGTNEVLLRRIAEATGGRVLGEDDPVFVHDLTRTRVPRETWPLLVALALALVPFDIFVRRVVVEKKDLVWLARKVASWIPYLGERLRGKQAADPTLAALLARKDALKKQEAERKVFQATGDQLARAAQADLGPADGDAAGPKGPTGPDAGAPPPPPPQVPAEAEAPDYTARLLQAKRRAMDAKKKPGQPGN
ncbi:MAG: VWA domain-containing protein [Planctomycetes bacterium]|nr:VWA domain-containing protein [Planctomycetota bacterium]